MSYLNQRRLAVTDMLGTHFLYMDSVVYIRADKSYCHIYYMDNGKLEHKHCSKSMGYYVNRFGLPLFIISRSHAVNLNFVQTVRNDRTLVMWCLITEVLSVSIELMLELKRLMLGQTPATGPSTPYRAALGN